MALVFSDDFNRANGAPGANWNFVFGTFAIASNRLSVIANSDPICYVGTGASLADQDVSADWISTTGNIGGLVTRCATDFDTFYDWRLYADGGWELQRTVDFSTSNLATDGGSKLTVSSPPYAARMVCTGVGATVTVAIYWGGVLVTSVGDSDGARLTAAGYAGIYGFGSATNLWDNFVLDDTAVAGGQTPYNPWPQRGPQLAHRQKLRRRTRDGIVLPSFDDVRHYGRAA